MAVSVTTNSESFKVSALSDQELRLTRLFDAPRRLVFEAMTRPEHVRQWWGCPDAGNSVPVCEIDLRPGGAWRFVNRSAKGEFAFYGVYREVTAPERLVYTEIFDRFPDTESVVTAVFAEEEGKTRVTVTVRYPSEQVRDAVLRSGMEPGAAASYDRLDDLLARLEAGP